MKLTEALLNIDRYFAPLVVKMTVKSLTAMDLELTDSLTNETVQLFEIPCRPSVSPAELYQLINLIESQAKARNPELFSSHVTHLLHQQ